MTWGENVMTPSSLNLLSLYPGSLTSVRFPWRTNGIAASTAITAIIMFAVRVHLYNRTFKCLAAKIPEHLPSTSEPNKVAWVLNGNRAFDLSRYLYSPCADKFIVKLNRMQCLYRTILPSHQRRCHITCGIQWMPSLGQHYSFDL